MRGIQAIGTSALFPTGIGIIRNTIQHNQNRVIGTLSVFATTSAAFGPTISGLLVQFGGWPVIFYVNLPILAIGIFLSLVYIPKDAKKSNTTSYRLDYIGILLFSALITCWMVFLLGLENGVQFGTLILAIVLTVGFYLYEKRKQEPFINVNFFQKNLHITLIFAQYVMSTVIFFSILLSMPTYLQTVIGTSSKASGLTMLFLSVVAMITTPFATRWMEKAGFRIPLLVSSVIGLVAVCFMFFIDESSVLFVVGGVLAVFGLNNGIQNIGLQNFLYSFIDKAETGIAAGLLMTCRYIGNILASSMYGIAFATGMNDGNMEKLTFIMLAVVILIIPVMFFITAPEKKVKSKMA